MAKTRRLAAILFSDIVGYTALMEADEARALAARDRHRAVLRPLAEQFQGELVEAPGDEALAVFPSSLRAVDCALAVQAALRDPEDLKLRIGIHVGDVLFRDGEVIGEGVNAAARIRPLAEPGGICVSGAVYQQVKNQRHLHGRSLGARALKNVARPIEVFALSTGDLPPPAPRRRRAWPALAVGAALLLGVASWWLLGRSPPEATSGHALAVLPFVNMSPDPDQAYFADGIAEELLNTLARFEGLRVVGRTSSFSFRDSDADLRTIGQTLHADVILEGSVRTAGDQVRITAQLVDAADGYHLWSETYDRELEDVFAIQTEIARAITEALRVQLSPEQHQRLATPPTRNLEAYQAYLLGRQRFDKTTVAATEEAIRHYERAIELDPTFALAHADLSGAYLFEFDESDLPPGEMIARAQAAARKALELDDGLAEAHAALGSIKWETNDVEGAVEAFQRALALNPNSVDTNLSYGQVLAMLGRHEESLALVRKAVDLDPLSLTTISTLGDTLQRLGHFEEALVWYQRALEIDPAFPRAHYSIGEHHRLAGRLDEAAAWWAKAAVLDPRSLFHLCNLGRLFLELGDPDRAEQWIHRADELAPENIFANLAMERLALYRGDEDAALYHGRKAFAIWPDWGDVLSLLRDQELSAGHYGEVSALYERSFPELLSESAPEVGLRNYRAALDLALVLLRTGERKRAQRLLEPSAELIQRRPRLGEWGFGIVDVQLYALRGEREKALSALRQAIDAGWRRDWWYWLQHKPDLEPLHDEPGFQAMVEEIRADMAAQLEHVREMERNGELTFPSERPAPATGSSPDGSAVTPPAGL